ncbi:MAG: hypothetical protein AAF191_01450, partial [Verrucomicrobiota bacterium]
IEKGAHFGYGSHGLTQIRLVEGAGVLQVLDDGKSAYLMCDSSLDLEHGIHDALFSDFTRAIIATSFQFIEAAIEEGIL